VHWHHAYSAWQARVRGQEQQQQRMREEQGERMREHEAKRLRQVFGGVESDGMELCGEMVGVVMGLFGGGMDYDDD